MGSYSIKLNCSDFLTVAHLLCNSRKNGITVKDIDIDFMIPKYSILFDTNTSESLPGCRFYQWVLNSMAIGLGCSKMWLRSNLHSILASFPLDYPIKNGKNLNPDVIDRLALVFRSDVARYDVG